MSAAAPSLCCGWSETSSSLNLFGRGSRHWSIPCAEDDQDESRYVTELAAALRVQLAQVIDADSRTAIAKR